MFAKIKLSQRQKVSNVSANVLLNSLNKFGKYKMKSSAKHFIPFSTNEFNKFNNTGA